MNIPIPAFWDVSLQSLLESSQILLGLFGIMGSRILGDFCYKPKVYQFMIGPVFEGFNQVLLGLDQRFVFLEKLDSEFGGKIVLEPATRPLHLGDCYRCFRKYRPSNSNHSLRWDRSCDHGNGRIRRSSQGKPDRRRRVARRSCPSPALPDRARPKALDPKRENPLRSSIGSLPSRASLRPKDLLQSAR